MTHNVIAHILVEQRSFNLIANSGDVTSERFPIKNCSAYQKVPLKTTKINNCSRSDKKLNQSQLKSFFFVWKHFRRVVNQNVRAGPGISNSCEKIV